MNTNDKLAILLMGKKKKAKDGKKQPAKKQNADSKTMKMMKMMR